MVLSLSGMAAHSLDVPEIVYAMNPWCLVPGLARGVLGQVKAGLQRRAYRRAMSTAHLMAFLSEYLRQAYRRNAGFHERASEVVYTGIDDETYAAADRLRSTVGRRQNQVVCVSAMARHKGIETLVEAMGILRDEHGVPSRLVLAGGWPDRGYERRVRGLVGRLRLTQHVEFRGHVARSELQQLYAESRVFGLMSRCESFGIPAVEAQAFGTPVVSSNCCAIPEVCGDGGIYPEPGDSHAAADAMAKLLTDEVAWRQLSDAAVHNAAKYRWDVCTRPLANMLESA